MWFIRGKDFGPHPHWTLLTFGPIILQSTFNTAIASFPIDSFMIDDWDWAIIFGTSSPDFTAQFRRLIFPMKYVVFQTDGFRFINGPLIWHRFGNATVNLYWIERLFTAEKIWFIISLNYDPMLFWVVVSRRNMGKFPGNMREILEKCEPRKFLRKAPDSPGASQVVLWGAEHSGR